VYDYDTTLSSGVKAAAPKVKERSFGPQALRMTTVVVLVAYFVRFSGLRHEDSL
jgi:hypothetical protein